jgi:hypothetical protein
MPRANWSKEERDRRERVAAFHKKFGEFLERRRLELGFTRKQARKGMYDLGTGRYECFERGNFFIEPSQWELEQVARGLALEPQKLIEVYAKCAIEQKVFKPLRETRPVFRKPLAVFKAEKRGMYLKRDDQVREVYGPEDIRLFKADRQMFYLYPYRAKKVFVNNDLVYEEIDRLKRKVISGTK